MTRIWPALWPSSLATRLFLIVTFVEFVVDITMEAILLYKGQLLHYFTSDKSSEHDALPVYLGIFAMAHMFQLVLAAEAIWSKNTIQIFGLTIFNALFLVYSIIQIGEVKTSFADLTGRPVDASVVGLTTAIPIVISLTEIAYIALSYSLYKEFGWSIFKTLGADRRIRRYYLAYQVFICVLKFDYFFFLAFSLQFILLVLNEGDAERWVTVAATPVILVILVVGFFAVKREHRALAISFMVFCVLGAGYFLYKLFRIYVGSQVQAYVPVRKSLTVFSALSLLMVVITFFMTAICYHNFDRGLRFHFRHRDRPKAAEAGYPEDDWGAAGSTYKLSSAATSRLSID